MPFFQVKLIYFHEINDPVMIGSIALEPGYAKVELRGEKKEGAVFAAVSDLEIRSETPGLELSYVKDNQNNRFYWGRRGPSVHLNYELPNGADIEYFYNEVTVPVGQDPIGSYFMADGFGEGYFGMQVNGPDERRVLFSVWSPYKTDHPGEIPETDKIVMLAKGEGSIPASSATKGRADKAISGFPGKPVPLTGFC